MALGGDMARDPRNEQLLRQAAQRAARKAVLEAARERARLQALAEAERERLGTQRVVAWCVLAWIVGAAGIGWAVGRWWW